MEVTPLRFYHSPRSRIPVASRCQDRLMRYIVGIDLGGTNIVAGCVAEDGSEILGVRNVPTVGDK